MYNKKKEDWNRAAPPHTREKEERYVHVFAARTVAKGSRGQMAGTTVPLRYRLMTYGLSHINHLHSALLCKKHKNLVSIFIQFFN